jgi:hypothetical protein
MPRRNRPRSWPRTVAGASMSDTAWPERGALAVASLDQPNALKEVCARTCRSPQRFARIRMRGRSTRRRATRPLPPPVRSEAALGIRLPPQRRSGCPLGPAPGASPKRDCEDAVADLAGRVLIDLCLCSAEGLRPGCAFADNEAGVIPSARCGSPDGSTPRCVVGSKRVLLGASVSYLRAGRSACAGFAESV